MHFEKNYLVRVTRTIAPISDQAIQNVLENYMGKNTATVTVKDIDTNSVNEHSLTYWKDQAIKSEQELAEVCLGADALRKDLVAARDTIVGLARLKGPELKERAEKAESALAEATSNIDELEAELEKARKALFMEVVDPQWRRRAYTAEDKVVELQAQLDALKTEEEKNAKEAAKSTVSEEYLRKHGGTLAPEFEAVYDALVAKAREQFFRGKK